MAKLGGGGNWRGRRRSPRIQRRRNRAQRGFEALIRRRRGQCPEPPQLHHVKGGGGTRWS